MQGMKRNRSDEASIPRYSRQMLVPQVGSSGQHSLRTASVIVIGGTRNFLFVRCACSVIMNMIPCSWRHRFIGASISRGGRDRALTRGGLRPGGAEQPAPTSATRRGGRGMGREQGALSRPPACTAELCHMCCAACDPTESGERAGSPAPTRCRGGRHGQPAVALPAERRMRLARKAAGGGLCGGAGGAGNGAVCPRWALLPMLTSLGRLVSRRAQLCGRGRAGPCAWTDRLPSGNRSHQAVVRGGDPNQQYTCCTPGAVSRPPVLLRRSSRGVSRLRCQCSRPRLRCLWVPTEDKVDE